MTGGSATSKSGGLVTTGRGGALASGGGKLGPVPKIEKVKVRDLGPSPSSGGPTRYQGTNPVVNSHREVALVAEWVKD